MITPKTILDIVMYTGGMLLYLGCIIRIIFLIHKLIYTWKMRPCKVHPRYQGKRKPRVDTNRTDECSCWRVYKARNK